MYMKSMRIILVIGFGFFLANCGGGGSSISVLPSVDQFKQHTNADVKIDILFVIDDSGSMKPEQQAIYNNFKEFIDLFYDKGFDFRVAVAKTSAYGTTINCKEIATGTSRTCSETGTHKYSSGNYISRENGLTPKEFRCGCVEIEGVVTCNNCGVNSEYQTVAVISGTEDDGETLLTTIGNGTPADGTDHILASHGAYGLSKSAMIEKFKRNILVGLAGTGDERAIESAETVIRNMKQFYLPENQFPRPNSHMAIIHVGDEGDGPVPGDTGTLIRTLNEDTVGTRLFGSNKGSSTASAGACTYSSTGPVICTSNWGSLRSASINNATVWPGYDPITLVANDNYVMADHLASVESYLEALKKHQATATVSVHAIEDLPDAPYLPDFLPSIATDTPGSDFNNAGNAIGYFQSYMAYLSGGLILSKEADFGTSLSDLGDRISSLASSFRLEEVLDANAIATLKVYVEGINGNNPLPKSSVNGYTYDEGTNSITFHGSMIPPQGAIIGITYTSGSL